MGEQRTDTGFILRLHEREPVPLRRCPQQTERCPGKDIGFNQLGTNRRRTPVDPCRGIAPANRRFRQLPIEQPVTNPVGQLHLLQTDVENELCRRKDTGSAVCRVDSGVGRIGIPHPRGVYLPATAHHFAQEIPGYYRKYQTVAQRRYHHRRDYNPYAALYGKLSRGFALPIGKAGFRIGHLRSRNQPKKPAIRRGLLFALSSNQGSKQGRSAISTQPAECLPKNPYRHTVEQLSFQNDK